MTEASPEPINAPKRRPKRLWLVLAVALVATLAAGFAVYRLTASERFDSPQAFVNRLAELGVPCGDFTPNKRWPNLAECRSPKALMSIEIIEGGMADEKWQTVFTIVEWGGPEYSAAYDDEWLIRGKDRAYLKKVADLLGSEFVTSAS